MMLEETSKFDKTGVPRGALPSGAYRENVGATIKGRGGGGLHRYRYIIGYMDAMHLYYEKPSTFLH